jgi:TPP-dependent pyruvate/acetoin dehydrogenase alpha subunit
MGETIIGEGPYKAWFETNDPVLKLVRELTAMDAGGGARVREIDDKVRARIDQAVEFATSSAFPSEESARDYVFA